MKSIKKYLVALLSTVLMLTSLSVAPALADETPLGNDDFNILVNKELNSKDLTLELKIKLEDKDPTTPKVVNDLSQVIQEEGKENKKLDLVEDKTDEYKMVVSENGEIEFELNYSKEVKAAEGETEAINRDEKHNFKVNVTEIEEPKAEEPKAEEPKAEEPKAEEPKAEEPKVQEPATDEDVVDAPKASADGITTYGVDGTVTVDVEDYNPALGWNMLDQKNVKINVDFKDHTSSDKILTVKIPSSFMYKRYPVKGTAQSVVEEPMTGVLEGLVESTEGASKSFHGEYGTITYKFKPTTEKAEIQLAVAPNINILNHDNLTGIILEAKLSKSGSDVDVFQSVVDLTGDMKSYFGTIEGDKYTNIEASLGTNKPVKFGRYHIGSSLAKDSSSQHLGIGRFYTKVVVTRYYPIGAKFLGLTQSGVEATVKEVNDAQGYMKYELKYPQSSQWIGIDLDVSDLPAGDHFAPAKSEAEVNFIDGTNKVIKQDHLQNIKIIDTSLLPNKMNIAVANAVYTDIAPNYTVAGPRFNFSTVAKELTDQFVSLDINPDLIVDKIRIPRGTTGDNEVKNVYYRTNLSGATIKTASGSQILQAWNYFEVNKKSLSLAENEYITYIEAKLGDFPANYSTTQGIHYVRPNDGNIINSKLKPGVSSADVTFKTYSKDSAGVIDPSSINQQKGIVTRKNINDTKSTLKSDTTIKPMVAGSSQNFTINLENSHYYYSDNIGTKNPTLLLIEKEGYNFDINEINVTSQNAKTGAKTNLTYDVSRRPHPNGVDNIVEIAVKGTAGTYFDNNQYVISVDLKLDTNKNANVNSHFSKIGFWSLDAKNLYTFNGQPSVIADADDLNQDGSLTDNLLPVYNRDFVIFPKEDLTIDTYIVPQGGSRQPAYDATLQNVVGFIPGSMSTYYVNILNNRKDTVKEIITYIPVPKTGMNLGTDFQDNKFEWDMTLANSPQIKVIDASGNDVTAVKAGNYVIEFTSDAIDSTNYKTASYSNAYNANTKMIRVTNTSNSIEAGEHAELKFDYEISETDISKVGKINDFRPFYSFEDTGNKGVEHGTRVGAELVIGEVSGIVFIDKNMNGIYDAGDTPAAGRTVKLCKVDAAGTGCELTDTTNTLADGTYAFVGLNSGNYTVDFNSAKKSTEQFTFKGQGTDSMKDSDSPISGANVGLVKNISSTQSSGQEVTAGVIEYDITTLGVTTSDKNVQIVQSLGKNIFEKDLTQSLTIAPSFFEKIKDTDNSLTWSSSDVSTVTVSNGVIQGKKTGNAIVTVTIKDMYGNIATETINVTVTSNTAPVLTLKNTTDNVEVNETVTLSDYIASVSDVEDAGLSASDVVITPATVNTSVVGSTQTVEYSVTDSHSNVTKATLTLKVVDTKKPGITAASTISWNNSTPKTEEDFKTLIGYTVSDNSNGTITTTTDFSTQLTSAVQGKPGTAIVTITAKDASGNTATHTVTVTLVDDVKPVLTADSEFTINSNDTDINKLSFYGAAHVNATDNSGTVNVTSDFDTVIIDQATPDAVGKDVTITATDVAGNVSTVKVKVFVKDTTKPTFVSAQNVVINSGDTDMTEAEFLTASAPVATDNDNKTPTFTSDFATVITDQNTPDATGKTVTITATDKAGNKSTKTVKVTVVDTTKPVIKNHKDVTINTGDTDMTAAEFLVASGATATDNDGAAPTITSDFATVITNQNTPDATGKTVTITATDIAGNVQTVTVKVFVKDTTKPIISGQLNVSINSDSHINAAQFLTSSAASATDNDGFAPTLTSDFDAVITDQDTPDLLGKTVTITATDKAGNSSSVTVLVTIIDTTKPTISNAKDVVIESDSPITEADFITASDYTVTDNNTVAPTVTTDFTAVMVDQLTPDATGKDVTITATDAAGNVQTQIVKVTVKDTTAPVLTVAKNKVIIKEVSSLTYADLAAEINATFTDNGDMTGVDVTVIDFENVKSDTVGTYTFKLQVTDKAGNESNIQTITVKVANEYNPTNAESIDGHDFKILIDDVNDANIKKLAEAVAHDVSVDPEVEIPLIVSHNITTVGNKQEVVFTTAKGSVLKVQADVYDAGNIVPGKGSIYANNFDMNISKLTAESAIKAAAVEAFDANGVAVNVKDIKLVTALPTDPGFHSLTFEANGVQVTVTGHIVARYEVVGHDLNMTVKEFNEFKANGTLKQEIIKRAEGKVWNVDLNKFSDLVDVDYTSVELAKVAPGVYNIVLNYTIDSDLLDGSMMSFGLNKVLSKQVKLSLVDDSKPVSPGNGNNGLGNGTSNGSGNGINTGSLPSTGVSVDATPIIIGAAILVLGLFLFLTNKKNKEEEQK